MSDLARLAGSTLCTGFTGDDARVAPLAELHELAPGALVLFARNVSDIERTRALVAAVSDAAGGDAPALVCVDQEGGRVARFRFGGELPSMLALGAANDETLAERAGTHLANELRALGASVDFAPVLDLALEPRSTVIGTRSFGDDAARVGRLGAALVRGLQSGGVAATAKHFPGHGGTETDSHATLGAVTHDAVTLRARDLVPFRSAIAAGVRGVMTAHVVVRAFDAMQPATLSPEILTTLLRGELGFTGVCFTDCLQMDAIARSVGTPRGAVLALVAGADCVVVSNDLDVARDVRDAIVAAVRSGELPLERLEEASARVGALRGAHARDAGRQRAPYPADDVLAREIARRALVVVRGSPVLEPARPVTVISFEGGDSDGVAAGRDERPSLSAALRRRRLRSEIFRVAATPDAAMREMLLEIVRAQGERNIVIVARRAHLREPQRRAIEAILVSAPAAIGISALEPFDIDAFARAETVVASFGDDESTIEALADLLTGRSVASGTMPVELAGARVR